MASATIAQNITTKSDLEYFKEALAKECKGETAHFLQVGGITDEFLTGPVPSEDYNNWSSHKATKYMIRMAIWQFYNDNSNNDHKKFDRKIYESYVDPTGIFTMIIWGKFRKLQQGWSVVNESRLRLIRLASRKRLEDDLSRGHMKRQAREKQQMLTMGNGDMELGRRKFEERMKIQKEVKLTRENDVSLSLEEEFAVWLKSSEFTRLYTRPMKESSTKHFSTVDSSTRPSTMSTINLKVNGISGLITALRQLSVHPESNTLTVDATLSWNEATPFSNPNAHVFTDDGISCLGGYNRVLQGEKIRVLGFVENNNVFYVVTPKFSDAYRNFPTRFSKLESRNPRLSTRLSVMYSVTFSLNHLTVSRNVDGKLIIMNISIIYNGADTVDAREIFTSPIVRDLKAISDEALAKKRAEKEQRVSEAKRDGLLVSKYKNIINDITSTIFTSPSRDTTNEIMKLCDMFEKGLLNKSQFEAAKDKVLS